MSASIKLAAYGLLLAAFYYDALDAGLNLSAKFKHFHTVSRSSSHARSGLHVSPWNSHWLVDLKDAQWHSFRDALPLLSVFMVVHAVVSRRIRGRREWWGVACGMALATALHGLDFVLVELPLLMAYFYWVVRFRPGAYAVYAAHGAALAATRASSVAFENGFLFPGSALLPFHATLPLVLLKTLSAGLDFDPKRSSTTTMLWYVVYAPLFVAGPIMTLSDFERQTITSERRRADVPTRYVFRVAFDFITMEVFSHVLYFGAINQQSFRYRVGIPNQAEKVPLLVFISDSDSRLLIYAAYWGVTFLWLKFLCVWRFARLSSLMEGVDPPENMRRCVNNNHTIKGFWRNWHSSYHEWLVKYVYKPVVSTFGTQVATACVFAYVAVWHDVEMRLVFWAALLSVGLVVERKLSNYATSRASRCFVGAITICALILANVVGFGGARPEIVVNLYFKPFLIKFLFFLAVGVSIMLDVERLKPS